MIKLGDLSVESSRRLHRRLRSPWRIQKQPRLKSWEVTSSGVDADPLPFPLPSLPHLPLFLHPTFHPFPSLHLLNTARTLRKICGTLPAKKTTVSCSSWRGPNTLGPHDLQSFKGTRLSARPPQSCSPRTLLQQLYWLPIKHRIDFKIANITFRTLHSSQPPSYVHSCRPVIPVVPSDSPTLIILISAHHLTLAVLAGQSL